MQIGKFHFGYSAIEDRGRRKAPIRNRRKEVEILPERKRTRLTATAEEQQRNLSLVAWMVRKHLDYVSRFHFSFRSDHPDLDAAVKRMFDWHARPVNFDVLGKFGREEMFRFFEMEKVIGGDAALMKLRDGKLQAVESDLIARGADAPGEVSEDGIIFNEIGKPIKAAICERGNAGKINHSRLVKWEDLIFDAYWTRFGSQYRGVSPLSTAINTMQDLCESTEFNLLKQKAQALFGMAIERESADGFLGGASGAIAEDEEASSTAENLELRPDKILMMDLEPGEKVSMLESRTPSAEFINGSYLFIQLAMLALDIPITCFDSRKSSFSARIADLNEYEVSAGYKRDKNRYVRQAYSDWLIDRDYFEPVWGIGTIAKKHGLKKRDVQSICEWVASGSPWLDKYKQIQGDELAINLFLDNPIDAARRKGQDVFNNIDQIKKVIDYSSEKGVPYNFGSTQKRTIEEMTTEEESGGENDTE